MDFFQNQDIARKKTGLLVFYFILAVVVIILSVYAALIAILSWADPPSHAQAAHGLGRLWDPELFGIIAAGTSALIGGGSLYKIAALSGGGHTVAEMLGGRLLDPANTSNADERKILNVVEEMAIASGVPVPPVYLLENETGINAFAAGHTTGNAVIAVTTGCIRHLSRDELQGVIAHEFSHILNGDMRLNIRLMGILFGILLIGLTGWVILRSSGGRGGDNRREDKNALPLIGLALYIIGYSGVFFGNLIKAAVSRQREFLADASAVQFTRNPDGIAGALKKIGALAEGSQIRDPHAEEASHLFFGNAVEGVGQLFGLLSTHPPLVERIRRIDPSFDGDFSKVRLEPVESQASKPVPTPRHAWVPGAKAFDPAQAVAGVGTIAPAHLAYAAGLLDSFPQPLTDAVREPLSAQAAVFALLLDPDPSIQGSQLSWLERHVLPAAVRETRVILADVQQLPAESRLPLVELAAPALRRLTASQLHDFLRSVDVLIQADRKTTLFEYALQKLLYRHVVSQVVRVQPPTVINSTPAALVGPVAVVLSALARVGHESPETISQGFTKGVTALGWAGVRPSPIIKEPLGLQEIDTALGQLAASTPQLKKQILEGCAACISADGRVTIEEGEMLRAISDVLGCPMPPLVETDVVHESA